MKKRGFTLIELLAVIVILAVIALIAVPIMLNIITKAQESSTLRGVELYIHGVEIALTHEELYSKNSIDGLYTIDSNGNICIENNCIKVDMKGKKPQSGFIRIENGSVVQIINMNIDSKIVSTIEDKIDIKQVN